MFTGILPPLVDSIRVRIFIKSFYTESKLKMYSEFPINIQVLNQYKFEEKNGRIKANSAFYKMFSMKSLITLSSVPG